MVVCVACVRAQTPAPHYDPNFDDHTVPSLATVEDFAHRATTEFGLSSTKFVITHFADDARRAVRFYDAHFYAMHDEWYWFRLLNGQPVPGDDVAPIGGMRFATVADIYAWYRSGHELVLGLDERDGRIYAQRFYDAAFGDDRRFGLGTIVYAPARAGAPERWAFELEYSDEISYECLTRFNTALHRTLPETVTRDLRFLVRSADQESLAARIEREHLPLHDRLLRYNELVVPGAREVYSDGVTAGRIRVVRRGSNPSTTPDDILVFEAIPDLLPPAAGLITAVPQTPLAHINLLARNRGIPNVHIAGVLTDATLGQLSRGYAPVVLVAETPDRVTVTALSEAQYLQYQNLVLRPVRAVQSPRASTIPYVIALSGRSSDEIEGLRATIGGKSSGMIALLATPGVEAPLRPLAITARAYLEHTEPLLARIRECLSDESFFFDARARQLVLEGEAAFRAQHHNPDDGVFLARWLQAHAQGTTVGALARDRGLRGLVERTPIAPAALHAIEAALHEAYGALAPTQGLRFRSSSNVEDIEGFNGAGLYESFTGFLEPAAQPDARDREKTVARAIARVWGSYWSFEAFEERRLERIDHLSAAMTVMVHPRFDDALERATGVCTFTVLPPGSPDAERLEVNVQPGAGSVANPDPTVLPEVVRVLRAHQGDALRIERARRASQAQDRDLLSDDALRRLFHNTATVARAWLARENASRRPAQRARTLTLDFEFHDMAAGWPAMRDATRHAARLVLKQVRTLEPGARITLAEASSWPLPRDVLVRARRVTLERCTARFAEGATLVTTALRAFTDASLPPDVGYATRPFEASLTWELREGALPAFGLTAGTQSTVTHLDYVIEPGATRTYRLSAGAPLDAMAIGDGSLTLTHGTATARAVAHCVTEVRFATPRDYLLGLVPR
jgi:hypothetical protein